ncbi:MAG TPA: hypothetical protein DD979_00460, partial [Gammaproteobacteria bacterium]|nr:hypothetical protein [Gammaproteobacteria bacterium]
RFVLNQTQLLCVSGKATCRAVCKAGSENTWVGFHIKKSWFETTDCDASLRSLEKLFDSGHVQRVLGPLTGLVQLGAQLQTPRYSGALQKLYTESCALSAVAELAHCLSNDSEKPVTINSRQLKRVKDAQAIIDQRLADPPSVDELCNSVAVNATSLRAHFREVLGTSIFGYLRTRRLEVAKILLEESELSIGEVGNRVGFSNAGAFSVAYRKRFGHRPSQVRSRKPD